MDGTLLMRRGRSSTRHVTGLVLALLGCELPETAQLPCEEDWHCARDGSEVCIAGHCAPKPDDTGPMTTPMPTDGQSSDAGSSEETSGGVGPGSSGSDTGSGPGDSTDDGAATSSSTATDGAGTSSTSGAGTSSSDPGQSTSTTMVGGTSSPGSSSTGCPVVPPPADSQTVWKVSAGKLHTCAVLSDRRAKCWGRNNAGQLGQGHTDPIGTQPGSMAMLEAIQLGPHLHARSALAGGLHSCAIMDIDRTTGSGIRCWGDNQDGQAGQESSLTAIGTVAGHMANLAEIDVGTVGEASEIVTGAGHACVIVGTTVKCWGRNDRGQLGQEHGVDVGGQSGDMGVNLLDTNLGTGVVPAAIVAGDNHTCVFTQQDGDVLCWGDNVRGQLGIESRDEIGSTLGSMGDNLNKAVLGTGDVVQGLTAGGEHTCVLLDDGRVKCWGSNRYGQLGAGVTDLAIGDDVGHLGDALDPVDLGLSITVREIVAGFAHTCVLADSLSVVGGVKCWGHNGRGQLGQANLDVVGDDPGEVAALAWVDLGTNVHAVQLSAGANHTCVLLDDGAVKCWGANHHGQLGQDHTDDVGFKECQMGDALPRVDL